MGMISGLRRFFGVPDRRFNYESPTYSLLIKGMFGQPPSRGTGFTARAEALEIPAVLRGRNLICSISTLPLEAVNARNEVQTHPLLGQFDPNVTNVVTLAQLVEDLLFDSVAWLKVTKQDSAGYPVNAIRIDPTQVSYTAPPEYKQGWLPSDLPTIGSLWMNGERVTFDRVIKFDSPNPPLMKVIRRVIARAVALDEAAGMYAENPRPADYFTPADPNADPLSGEDVDDILDSWKRARQVRTTAYVPASLRYESVQQPTPADLQLAQLQKQVGLEIANALGLDPEDLGLSTTSRTYQNATDRRKDRINDTLAPYMEAITQRLTMPDVTKRGIRARFNLDTYLKADPLTRAQVADIYIRNGVWSREWVAGVVEQSPPAALPPTPAPEQRPAINVGEATVTEPQRLAIAANDDRPQYRFSLAEHELTFESEAVAGAFAADPQRRTITGLIIPWGETARSGGQTWRFERGGLEPIANLRKVKLLRDHDNSQALGYALSIEETDEGLVGTFSVAPGPEGDRALALAAHGTLDGLSIGADWSSDAFSRDPLNPGVHLVHRYTMKETSLTAMPAFTNSRLTSVRASESTETEPVMPEPTTPQAAPATEPVTTAPAPTPAPTAPAAPQAPAPAAAPAPVVTFSAEQFTEFMAAQRAGAGSVVRDGQVTGPAPEDLAASEPRPTVDPTTGAVTAAFVSEPLPYRFSYERPVAGRAGRYNFRDDAEHDLSRDLFGLIRDGIKDPSDPRSRRISDMVRRTFAVTVSNVGAVTPNRDRPDLWVPQMDYPTPLWDMVNAGTLQDGTPFDIPKFSSASGLVSTATAGTEPSPGSFAATTQTITPTQLWGKVEIERQAIRRGGNPQISGIIWDQMLRSYFEAREAAIATFLNTLTAATDIAIPQTSGVPDNTDDMAGAAALKAAIASLQFVRGGNRFTAGAAHIDLYKMLARVTDTAGREMFPMINPMNASGTAATLYATINVAGTTFVPAYALGATSTDTQNSWLFDPSKVLAWASEPDRLEWDFGATVQSNNVTQLAYVTMGIYGDVAVGNTDINGVRQVTYDSTGS